MTDRSTGPLAAEFIQRVEERIRDVVSLQVADDGVIPAVLLEASAHLVSAGGKRLRPRLASLFGEGLGVQQQPLIDIGVAAELIHAASLLHDDVVDGADQRRGRPTACRVYGNNAAVLAGDWLIAQALVQLRGHPPDVLHGAVSCVARMSGAAMHEVHARGDATLTLERWRRIAEGKTGVLFAWIGDAVSVHAANADAGTRLRNFGMHLGVSFQLADDLKDVLGADPGKPRFADLRNQNPNFVHAWASTGAPATGALIADAWARGLSDDPTVTRLGQGLIDAGGIDACVKALNQQIHLTFSALGDDARLPWARALRHLADRFVDAHAPAIEGEFESGSTVSRE